MITMKILGIKKINLQKAVPFVFLFLLGACTNECKNKVTEIGLSAPGRNTLKVQVDVKTSSPIDTYVEYWRTDSAAQIFTSTISKQNSSHRFVLTNLQPQQHYKYKVITKKGDCSAESKTYNFSTPNYPMWFQDFFKIICPQPEKLPASFKEGSMLIYRRDEPGILFLINHKGDIRWYHQVNGTGFKVAHFTQNKTLLSILGSHEYETSYGNEILEVSLAGDTLLHLKKGMNDFKQIIHHEILLNPANHVVTLCVEERTFDLRSRGGGIADTVKGDGILVLDRQGKQVFKWTVFDDVDPLADKEILKTKKDWMHANSVTFDKDGNYLISFYNNGQIWKINAKTGKLMWKFGRNGDFPMPEDGIFDQAHCVHINNRGELMFFDNGVSKRQSRTLAFNINEADKRAEISINTKLPADIYNERMGSSYLLENKYLLQCCSKKNSVVLTDMNGIYVWLLQTGLLPYRVEFIPKELLEPYIVN